MRIRFISRAQLESEGRGKGPVYEDGSEQEMRQDQAERWLRRGMAVVVLESQLPQPAPTTPDPEADVAALGVTGPVRGKKV